MDGHGIEPTAKRFKTDFSCNPIVINSDDLHNGAGIEVEICYPNFEDNQQNEVIFILNTMLLFYTY